MGATEWLLVIRGIVEGVMIVIRAFNGGEPTDEELDQKFGKWEDAKEEWSKVNQPPPETGPPATD